MSVFPPKTVVINVEDANTKEFTEVPVEHPRGLRKVADASDVHSVFEETHADWKQFFDRHPKLKGTEEKLAVLTDLWWFLYHSGYTGTNPTEPTIPAAGYLWVMQRDPVGATYEDEEALIPGGKTNALGAVLDVILQCEKRGHTDGLALTRAFFVQATELKAFRKGKRHTRIVRW